MTSPVYQKLIEAVRQNVRELSVEELQTELKGGRAPVLLDVREESEFIGGHIPGAQYTGRGRLEQKIEKLVPDPEKPIVCYCAGGNRSLFAAETLQRMGYKNVRSLNGGYGSWIQSSTSINPET